MQLKSTSTATTPHKSNLSFSLQQKDPTMSSTQTPQTLTTTCHCATIKITFPYPTQPLTECLCSICRRYAGLWTYVAPQDVKIEGGPTDVYMWQDNDIEFHRCRKCGCATHSLPAHEGTRQLVTVNCRMLEKEALGKLEIVRINETN